MKTIFKVIATMVATATPALTADTRVVIRDERQPEQKQAYTNFIGNHLAIEPGKREGIKVVKSLGLGDEPGGISNATLDNCDVIRWMGGQGH
jgi:hypothetical protein